MFPASSQVWKGDILWTHAVFQLLLELIFFDKLCHNKLIQEVKLPCSRTTSSTSRMPPKATPVTRMAQSTASGAALCQIISKLRVT